MKEIWRKVREIMRASKWDYLEREETVEEIIKEIDELCNKILEIYRKGVE